MGVIDPQDELRGGTSGCLALRGCRLLGGDGEGGEMTRAADV